MGFRGYSPRRRCNQLRTVAILGSTGSIGTQALEVVKNAEDVRVVALAVGSRWDKGLQQAKDFGVPLLAVTDPEAASMAKKASVGMGLDNLEIVSGHTGLEEAARFPDAEVILHAVPGFAGIRPLLASLESKKQVAFAGKEALVSAGDLIKPYINNNPERFVPVDSEHSAIFQCLLGENRDSVEEIVLTASGGALRDTSLGDMAVVTPEMVLRHPTWRMGKKVTVDSATLFNKALEVMEAHFLFGVEYNRIKVIVHRQSIVHSMVTFKDGSTKAQAAPPDMRLAISYGMMYPQRAPTGAPSLTPYVGTLTFEKPDTKRFPWLKLGYVAGEMGGTAPCVVSWADEILVRKFLSGDIGFLDMYPILSQLMDDYSPKAVSGLHTLEVECDWASAKVEELLKSRRR